LTVLPLLAWIVLELFQLLQRSPSTSVGSGRIATALEVVATAHQLERTLTTTERAQLTYLAAAGVGSLDLQRTAGEAPALLSKLRSLTADDLQQRQRVERLEEHLAVEFQRTNQIAGAIAREDLQAARRLIPNQPGADAMPAVTELIGSIIAAENQQGRSDLTRLADTDRKAVRSALSLGAIAAALTMAGILFTAFGSRSLRRAERARRAIELQQQRSLAEAQSALAQSQKMEALGRLAGEIGHDFNNLLAVIRTDIELLQQCLEGGDSRARRYIDMAKRSTDRAASVMQRLLGFSRQQPVTSRPVEVNEVIREMTELLRHALAGVSVRTVLGNNVGATIVDSSGFEAAILNLAVNARDAMKASGELTIETAGAVLDQDYALRHRDVTPGHYVMIALTDTGIGMSAEVIARACDPFFTTKEAGEGTGLGLSQVRNFVKQARGHLAIESELGVGTTVRLYLPRFPRLAPVHSGIFVRA